jgi:hypothetical protein
MSKTDSRGRRKMKRREGYLREKKKDGQKLKERG